MNNHDILNEFKANIRIELDQCNGVETPHVCQLIAGAAGYEKVEKWIADRVVTRKITIGEAIVEIENELNPDAYAD